CGLGARMSAYLTSAAATAGNSDHNNAMAPVTNAAAMLVPSEVIGPPAGARLVILTPGALNPRVPIAFPRFDAPTGRPWRSQATTEMTQGWRVIAVLPMAA